MDDPPATDTAWPATDRPPKETRKAQITVFILMPVLHIPMRLTPMVISKIPFSAADAVSHGSMPKTPDDSRMFIPMINTII